MRRFRILVQCGPDCEGCACTRNSTPGERWDCDDPHHHEDIIFEPRRIAKRGVRKLMERQRGTK